MIENTEIYHATEKLLHGPLHDHENGISILHHVIVNSQSNRNNITRCYIKQTNLSAQRHFLILYCLYLKLNLREGYNIFKIQVLKRSLVKAF